MKVPLSSGLKQISCLAVVLLTLWLNGFGCVLCCSTGLGDHCCSSEQSTCSPSSETEDDCCESEKKQYDSTEAYISKLPDVGCSLLPSQAPTEFRRLNATSLVSAVLPVTHFLPQLETSERTPVSAISSLPANRGSTYLRCCTFLI
jgi:hypothetical protein